MIKTIYKPGVPAIELCFDTDIVNVWDGYSVVQFKCKSLHDLSHLLHEITSDEYKDCPIFGTIWAKHYVMKS